MDEPSAPKSLQPWRSWYNAPQWRKRRRMQLLAHPLCKMCAGRGVVTVATVVDHEPPHRGEWNAFLLGPVQSLCKPCHDQGKRQADLRGYMPDIDDDGWPTDPRHPANRK
jgi:hypothetical protein